MFPTMNDKDNVWVLQCEDFMTKLGGLHFNHGGGKTIQITYNV